MALNCILKGNDVFKMAIALLRSPPGVFYDTIYTEIYNGDLNENPSGYDDNSPINPCRPAWRNGLRMHADDSIIQNTHEMVEKRSRQR